MGNHCSSNKEKLVQELWKERRAVLGLPVNPNLVPGRVLCKRSDGYYDGGTVHSLSQPGSGKDWLKEAIRPRRDNKYLLSLKSVGHQPYVLSDDDGAFAKGLVGPVNAAAWFKEFESIEVHVPGCQIHEFDLKEWDEMMKHFDPDLRSTALRPLQNGWLELFIVQKVLLVSQIKITASYGRDTGLDFRNSEGLFQNVNIEASFRTSSSNIIGEFTLSATEKNKKLPVAFSGFSYRYDKFGVQERKEIRCEADGDGESSGASQADSDTDEDDPEDDPDVGPLLEFSDSRFAEAKYVELYDPVEEDEEEEQEGEGDDEDEDEDEVVDQNAAGMEDID